MISNTISPQFIYNLSMLIIALYNVFIILNICIVGTLLNYVSLLNLIVKIRIKIENQKSIY